MRHLDEFPDNSDILLLRLEPGALMKSYQRQIDTLTDDEMAYIAAKMADAYLEMCYWESLRVIAGTVLEEKQ